MDHPELVPVCHPREGDRTTAVAEQGCSDLGLKGCLQPAGEESIPGCCLLGHHGNGEDGHCHRQVQAVWVSAGVSLPEFDPAERRAVKWAQPNTPTHSAPPAPRFDGSTNKAAHSQGPASIRNHGPAHRHSHNSGPTHNPTQGPPQRSRSGQPRLAPERRRDPGEDRQPHDPMDSAHGHTHNHAHGRGHGHWRRGPQRGHGGGRRKRWSSEGDGGSPWQHSSVTMTAVQYMAHERIWFDKSRYDEAERRFYEGVNGPTHVPQDAGANSILRDIARARENIQKSLTGLKTSLHPNRGAHHHRGRHGRPAAMSAAGDQGEMVSRMRSLELENQTLQNVVQDLRSALLSLESRVTLLESAPTGAASVQVTRAQQVMVHAPVEEEEEEEDDLDLFGSDEEDDEEAERIREQRVKEYSERKAKKPALIAKSSILLDVKPWDDETDMVKLEECVRSVQADGLLWGSSKLVPVGYGIKKLQIQCVVEDDKVGTDMLEEEITKFEDYVQSVDVAAFNKI